MTQTGELFEKISVKVRKAGLNVKLVGFADYSELLSLYRGCSAYIASGREEPWGMRINDALNCGAPLIVSSGMGGVKLVRDYGCGVEYDGRSSRSLAHAIECLMKNQGAYMDIVSRVGRAVATCSPEAKATELRQKLAMYKGWE